MKTEKILKLASDEHAALEILLTEQTELWQKYCDARDAVNVKITNARGKLSMAMHMLSNRSDK